MKRAIHLIGAGVLVLAGVSAGLGQAAKTPPPVCPPIERLVWKAPQRITWQMAETPLWFSLGHPARVMCWIPLAVEERSGKAAQTHSVSGRVYAVRIELHDVLAFGPNGAPLETRLMTNVTIRADDTNALVRKSGWGFPTEQGKDFEFSLIPALEHQSLFRLYRHDNSTLWQTLMIHTEAKTEAMPPALVEASGSARHFKTFMTHTIVCELLHEPDLRMTSTYIEPDDPPSDTWLEKESVKPPWSAGKAALEPARGSLEFEGGAMRFAPFNVEAQLAAKEIARILREQGVPSMSIQWGKDAGVEELGFEGGAETEGH
jgi:hypothetical protein